MSKSFANFSHRWSLKGRKKRSLGILHTFWTQVPGLTQTANIFSHSAAACLFPPLNAIFQQTQDLSCNMVHLLNLFLYSEHFCCLVKFLPQDHESVYYV